MTEKALTLLLLLPLSAFAQEKTIDLTSPENYANQPIPAYITKDNTPVGNDITDLGATLGRVLFYDKRLSRYDTVSCSSCHHQENGFSDTATASTGVNGTTGRHSMRLINSRFSNEEKFFWDERAASVEDQATKPIQDHIEMGFSGADGDPSFADLVVKLSAIEEYQVLFQGVFGDAAITEERVGKALAQFVRSIQSFDSKYDVGRAQRNDNQNFLNFTAAENAGKQLFLAPPNVGGAGCAVCHTPPEFDIDPNSGNNGIVGSLGGGMDFANTRSPSLRDLVDPSGNPHGGFMHDASLPTLLSVIDHYNAIPAIVTGLDPRLTRPGPGAPQPQTLNLTAQQKSNLVDFLKTLTGSAIYTEEKYSTPFNTDDTLAVVILPTESAEMTFATDGSNNQTAILKATGVPNVG
ncbi:MAG: cytochrome-c peroxidase [Akkermansiaceae bacterium]|nr:cytochrome-c peroxidase [Akkermansiaceae bacterium]MDP4647746.1 cytochrome-c peroxidase [Akkermansiaceae bacterium]MDP4722192.1 cytochrome-c peroxidase [Akkermansiaceae bacterium]MDP4780234.1 cytochrome-c peroxidase [Akkermansiaceae bacterium]MDP4848603.1 cytochrome-c peroxidase [Akkermansiaceae bacterium]